MTKKLSRSHSASGVSGSLASAAAAASVRAACNTRSLSRRRRNRECAPGRTAAGHWAATVRARSARWSWPRTWLRNGASASAGNRSSGGVSRSTGFIPGHGWRREGWRRAGRKRGAGPSIPPGDGNVVRPGRAVANGAGEPPAAGEGQRLQSCHLLRCPANSEGRMPRTKLTFRFKALTVACSDLRRSERFYKSLLGAAVVKTPDGIGCPWFRLGSFVFTLMPGAVARGPGEYMTHASYVLWLEVDHL